MYYQTWHGRAFVMGRSDWVRPESDMLPRLWVLSVVLHRTRTEMPVVSKGFLEVFVVEIFGALERKLAVLVGGFNARQITRIKVLESD